MIYIICLLTVLLIICFTLLIKNKVKQKEIDNSYYEKINQLNDEISKIEYQKGQEQEKLSILIQRKDLSQKELQSLQDSFNSLTTNVKALEDNAQKTADAFLRQKMDKVEATFDKRTEELGQEYQTAKAEYIKDYQSMLKDYSQSFQKASDELTQEIEYLKSQKQDCSNQVKALSNQIELIVEANKRAELERNEKNFYRLTLTQNELADVKVLKEIEPLLINKEVLAKLIWKTYYERAYTEMCNRVLGAGTKMGIYRITNLDNNMAYVGQSVNIRERWREHIKAGLGINSSNNRLYSSMKQFGPENFMFEVLEECERPALNERERYWIDFYRTESFGLNSNKGIKKGS